MRRTAITRMVREGKGNREVGRNGECMTSSHMMTMSSMSIMSISIMSVNEYQ